MTDTTITARPILLAAVATAALLAASGLAACTTLTPQEQPQMQADADRPVTCEGQADCELKWGRALQWVLANSEYKIQVQSDVLITTMGPLPNDASSAFTISKVPLGEGRYRIDFQAGCDNLIACIPSLLSLKASFARTVMGP